MERTDFDKGWSLLEEMAPGQPDALARTFADIAPDVANYVIAFGYGEVLSRPGLDIRSRQVATLAALAALGTAPEQLGFHIGASLNVGVSAREMVEVFYLVAVFAGFPACLNALSVARGVFDSRGVKLEPVESYATEGNRRERGLAALESTSKGAGRKVIESLQDIAQDFGGFIVDFSYGDVIARQVLTSKNKEIAMIAAAAARGTMRPQLKVHISAGLSVGLERSELVEILIQMAVYAGFPSALNGLFVAKEVFGERDSQTQSTKNNA
jgi:4-carboxymuconolactone decarboxylase